MVSHAKFKVTSFVDFDPYLKSFNALDNYTENLVQQLTYLLIDKVTIHMEPYLIFSSFLAILMLRNPLQNSEICFFYNHTEKQYTLK